MSDETFNYKQLSNDDLQKTWDKHRVIIESFLSSNRYNQKSIVINENTMISVIVKVDQRRKYFEYFHKLKMSEYKEAALNAYWIIKLQPLSVSSQKLIKEQPKEYDSLNEKLAIYYIIKALRGALKESNRPSTALDDLPKQYINELIYTFTFRDISKEALIMLVESMAVFMGLNPYDSLN